MRGAKRSLAVAAQLQVAASILSRALLLFLSSVMVSGSGTPPDDRFVSAQRMIEGGDYDGAVRALESLQCRPGDGEACKPRVFSMRGAALLFGGKYEQALTAFQEALGLNRRLGNAGQIVDLLNNIGTVHFYMGEYAEAHSRYQEAERELGGRQAEGWFASASQLTAANMATLYQRLGKYREALQAYQSLGLDPKGLSGPERAQLWSNLAALNRRLGDPWKARALLGRAKSLLRRGPHSDVWLGATKNLGIVLALDFGDLKAAELIFREALSVAQKSGNSREALQARMYLAETLFRGGKEASASELWQTTLEESLRLKTAEEVWRSRYGLARALMREGKQHEAEAQLRQAMEAVESLRGGIGAPSMKTEFLSDRNEVHEMAMSLCAGKNDVEGALQTLERSRALRLQEGLGAPSDRPGLGELQARMEKGELALLYMAGQQETFLIWVERGRAGLRRIALKESDAARMIQRVRADADGAAEEKRALAQLLLSGVPPLNEQGTGRVWIAADGVFSLAPFELLTVGGRMLVERFEVAYLPAASLFRNGVPPKRGLRWPWERELIAYADPDVRWPGLLPGDGRWARLVESGSEVEAVRTLLPGRAEIYRGGEVTPLEFLRKAAGAPVVHLATHGAGDPELSQRNRMLVGRGYLYESQLAAGKLEGVRLAVLSACDTETGTLIRGEGVQSLARSFLLAGARATVASLWKVDDRATRLFMMEFYRELAAGRGVAAALREAKLRFLRTGGALSAPRHWAAFIVQGAGDESLPRWVSWQEIAWLTAAGSGLAALGCFLFSRRRA